MPPASLEEFDHIEPRSALLQELAARGFVYQTSNLGRLDAALNAGVLACYAGFDATADSLHVGHLQTIMALRRVQQAGHKPIILMRGGRRTSSEINRFRESLGRFLRFGDGAADALLVDASDWRGAGYSNVHAQDYLELARRNDARLQLGAADQWADMLAGVDLVRREGGGPVFALTMPILDNLAPGAIWLSPEKLSAEAYWAYWHATEDQDVPQFLRLFTDASLERIAALEWRRGAALDAAKHLLAFEATRLAHGLKAAEQEAGSSAMLTAEHAA